MTLFPTTLVGSFPQPEWLIDRSKLAGRFPPRVRARELWRIAEPYLAEALDDATTLAIQAQEQAGLDIITDGEIRRESYSNRFATALDGVDVDNGGARSQQPSKSSAARSQADPSPTSVEVDDVRSKSRTSRP
jgi:5-methyltetrahydropteroyltriglutamate--homocysteine methyltransferase